jgi:hypothetical protein
MGDDSNGGLTAGCGEPNEERLFLVRGVHVHSTADPFQLQTAVPVQTIVVLGAFTLPANGSCRRFRIAYFLCPSSKCDYVLG